MCSGRFDPYLLDIARRRVAELPGKHTHEVTRAHGSALRKNLNREMFREVLAQRAAMSPRNFVRVFARELGNTPARYVEQVRVEAARTQLAATQDSMELIAGRCGFSSAELLRRCFVRYFKIAPSQYRKHFHTPVAARELRTGRAGPSMSNGVAMEAPNSA